MEPELAVRLTAPDVSMALVEIPLPLRVTAPAPAVMLPVLMNGEPVAPPVRVTAPPALDSAPLEICERAVSVIAPLAVIAPVKIEPVEDRSTVPFAPIVPVETEVPERFTAPLEAIALVEIEPAAVRLKGPLVTLRSWTFPA